MASAKNPFTACAFALALTLAAAAPADTPAELPSTQDVQALMDAKQYSDALGQLRHLLDLKGDAAAKYDRHLLQMMRFECLLQTKDQENALKTLTTAQSEAKKVPDADEPAALIVLLHRAPKYTYTPKTGGKPLNILDKDERHKAFESMWQDIEPTIAALTKNDKKYTSMPPIMADADTMVAARPIEFMATGSIDEYKALNKSLSGKAVKLLDAQLTQMDSAVTAAEKNANFEIIDVLPDGRPYRHRTGITAADGKSLENVRALGNQFPPNMLKMAQLFDDDSRTYSQYADRAVKIAAHALSVERASYQ